LEELTNRLQIQIEKLVKVHGSNQVIDNTEFIEVLPINQPASTLQHLSISELKSRLISAFLQSATVRKAFFYSLIADYLHWGKIQRRQDKSVMSEETHYFSD
jgi:hypothetical protein